MGQRPEDDVTLLMCEGAYRGRDGFTLYGTNTDGRKVKIFATSRYAIEHIRNKVWNNETITVDDFKDWEP